MSPPQGPRALWQRRVLVRREHLDLGQGFKVLKRGGGQWQRTRMTAPTRAERLWLALAVVTL